MRQIALRLLVFVGLLIAAAAPRLAVANPIFVDGFESGLGNWTTTVTTSSGSPSTNTWGVSATSSHTGSYSLTETPVGSYLNSMIYTATKTLPFSLANSNIASPPTLSFWHTYETESCCDELWVEISSNGTSFTALPTSSSYFQGTLPTYTKVTLSLAAYVGQPNLYLRFRETPDISNVGTGWNIDDLVIDDGITAVTVTSPTGTSAWAGGTAHAVNWTYDQSLAGAASFRVGYSTDGGSTFGGVIANAVPIAATGTVNWTVPAASNSTSAVVRVQVLDGTGNVLGQGYSGTFVLDSTPPPPVNLSSPSNGACVGPTPTLSWSSATGAASYNLTVTRMNGQPIGKVGLTSTSYTFLPSEALTTAGNPYTWYITDTDNAGNSTNSSTSSFFVDATPPAAFGLAAPAANAWAKPTSSFSWNAAVDSGCVSGTVTYTLYVDSVACGTSTTTSIIPTCTLTQGSHTWAVKAVDSVGNTAWCTESPAGVGGRVVNIDAAAPGGTTLTAPASGSVVGTPTPVFSWTAATDTGGAAGITYQLYIDSLAVGAAIPGLTLTPETPIREGSHTWYVRISDAAGNFVNTPEWSLYLDTGVPAAFSLLTPANLGCSVTPTPSLCWYAAADAGGIASYQLFIDDAPNATTANGTTTCQTPTAALTQGTHTWTVRATDRGGHTTPASETRTLVVDWTRPTAPELASPADGASLGALSPQLTWAAATDSVGVTRYEVYIDGLLAGSTTGAVLTYAAARLSQGPHTWYVRAVDACQAYAQSAQWSFSLVACTSGTNEACAGSNIGACRAGVRLCTGGIWGPCTGVVLPSTEVCNGVDDDCDGQIDEAPLTCCTSGTSQSCYAGAAGTAGVGLCRAGTQACTSNTWGTCTGQVVPATEVCNGADDDCDGQIDEGLAGCCTSGGTQPCYMGAAGTAGVGLCKAGTQTCTNGTWGACTGQVVPGTEVCNGVDDNCNGQADEGLAGCCTSGATQPCYAGAAGTAGVGLCKAGTQTCANGAWGACSGQVVSIAEICNGLDDDCDGQADDGLAGCDACPSTSRVCYTGPAKTEGVGLCQAGSQTCSKGVWAECSGEIVPATEVCNGLDDDCDGQTDEGLSSCGSSGGDPDSDAGKAKGEPDAGTSKPKSDPDAGVEEPTIAKSSTGCKCSTTGSGQAPPVLVLLGLGLLVGWRKRRK